jgi:hypothetical protein
MKEPEEKLTLSQAATFLLGECRMVLPGIQTLFGFQLIAVFNDPFFDKLTQGEQTLHLAATGLVAISVVLVMGPAAYHRETMPMAMTKVFIAVATRLLLWSMYPLMVGTCLDFYLIAKIILGDRIISSVLAIILLVIFVAFWSLLPRIKALQHLIGADYQDLK